MRKRGPLRQSDVELGVAIIGAAGVISAAVAAKSAAAVRVALFVCVPVCVILVVARFRHLLAAALAWTLVSLIQSSELVATVVLGVLRLTWITTHRIALETLDALTRELSSVRWRLQYAWFCAKAWAFMSLVDYFCTRYPSMAERLAPYHVEYLRPGAMAPLRRAAIGFFVRTAQIPLLWLWRLRLRSRRSFDVTVSAPRIKSIVIARSHVHDLRNRISARRTRDWDGQVQCAVA